MEDGKITVKEEKKYGYAGCLSRNMWSYRNNKNLQLRCVWSIYRWKYVDGDDLVLSIWGLWLFAAVNLRYKYKFGRGWKSSIVVIFIWYFEMCL